MTKRKKKLSKKSFHSSKSQKQKQSEQNTLITGTSYIEEEDKVVWQCSRDGEEFTLEWPAKDFGPAMGIKADLPRPMIVDFLPKMIGKKIYVVDRQINDEKDIKPAITKVKKGNPVFHQYVKEEKPL